MTHQMKKKRKSTYVKYTSSCLVEYIYIERKRPFISFFPGILLFGWLAVEAHSKLAMKLRRVHSSSLLDQRYTLLLEKRLNSSYKPLVVERPLYIVIPDRKRQRWPNLIGA